MGLRSLCPSLGSGTLHEEHHECSNRAESKSPGDDEGKQLPASAAGRKPLRQIRRHLTHHPSSTSPPTRGALDSPHSLLFFPRPRLAPSVAREVGSSWRAYRYGASPPRRCADRSPAGAQTREQRSCRNLGSSLGVIGHFLSLTPGRSPSMNSTPARSSAVRSDARSSGFGFPQPPSKSRMTRMGTTAAAASCAMFMLTSARPARHCAGVTCPCPSAT
jgi:hypothetical protein